MKVHILHHASQEAIYGVAMMEELRRHGYDIGASMMYPLLHRLSILGYLVQENRVVQGKLRKYYTITPEGIKALQEIKLKICELVREVTEGDQT